MKTKHWLIVYDIRDADRLRKAAVHIECYALRVQKSVFEAAASDTVIQNLKRRLERILTAEDFVLFFPVCERDWQKKECYGISSKTTKHYIQDDKFAIL